MSKDGKMPEERKVQTNLKLSAERAAALDMASAVEHKDKAQIVEEALRLREELMGSEYSAIIKAALTVRFSDNPEDRVAAIETVRDVVLLAITKCDQFRSRIVTR